MGLVPISDYHPEWDEPEFGCKPCSEMCDPPCAECMAAFDQQAADEAEAMADQHEAMAESGDYDP